METLITVLFVLFLLLIAGQLLAMLLLDGLLLGILAWVGITTFWRHHHPPH